MLEVVDSIKNLLSHRKKEDRCSPPRTKSSEYRLEKMLQDGIRSQVFLAKNIKGERCVLKKIDESAVDSKKIKGEITAMKKTLSSRCCKTVGSLSRRRIHLLDHRICGRTGFISITREQGL